MLLPATTNDLLFSCLDPHDIIHYSQTCREAYRQVESYWRRALRIDDLLSPFFTRPETKYFRIVQALTGALISGSMALQLLSRNRYPDSDLDIYVEHRYSSFVGSFLEVIGYQFKPGHEQPKDLQTAIKKVAHDVKTPAAYGYAPARGFAGVFNMVKGESKIQLITAVESPLDIILNFHSTVVMNVISYSHVYSIYPRATFKESLSLRTYSNEGYERELARQKYVDRGWKMLNADGSEWKLNGSSSGISSGGFGAYGSYGLEGGLTDKQLGIFRVNEFRRLGDPFCWTFKLPKLDFPTETDSCEDRVLRWLSSRNCHLPTPLILEELQSGKQVLECNTWVLSLQDYAEEDDDYRRALSHSVQTRLRTRRGHRVSQTFDTYRMLYDVYGDKELRFTYCIALESDESGPPDNMDLIDRVRRSEAYKGIKDWTRGKYGLTAPLDFQANSKDIFLSNVVEVYVQRLNEVNEEYSEDRVVNLGSLDPRSEIPRWVTGYLQASG